MRTSTMLARFRNRFQFLIERMLLRGAHVRLLLIASFVGLVAVAGGILVQVTDAPFDDYTTAIWWAFLRLTDPGYLGDDEGVARRVISTAVTILGYVLFMGSLIAIMTQWLNQTIRKLEQGFTPIAQNNHILILGWTNRTPEIVEELMRSEGRVKRFLRRFRARGLQVVILAEDVSMERTLELRDELGDLWDAKRVTFRSGTPLRIEHLERVDFHHAGAIILPGADFVYGSADASDARIIKTLLSIANHEDEDDTSLPLLVTEIFDPSKVEMVRQAYRGPVEILASDIFIARCLAQNVRHTGLSRVFREILSHGDGSEIYVRTPDQFAGFKFGDLNDAYPLAVLLGVVRPTETGFEPLLNPPRDFELHIGDRLIFLARSYEDCDPPKDFEPKERDQEFDGVMPAPVQPHRRVLMLGWNHKAADLLAEFDRYEHESFDLDVLSLTPKQDREIDIKRKGVILSRAVVQHFEGDYTSLFDLQNLKPETYDNVIVLGSDRLDTEQESDARTIVGHMTLSETIKRSDKTGVIVELMDPENLAMFDGRLGEVLVTPVMASHVLAQVALRRELNAVYEELFGPGGAEIFFRPAADYGLVGRLINFRKLKSMAFHRGEIALGVRVCHDGIPGGEWVYLNPPWDQEWTLREGDELVVLATYGLSDYREKE